MTSRLCPRIVAKLDEIGAVAGHCFSTYDGDGLYKVTHNKQQAIYCKFVEENLWM
jgi:hypothetical protein